ncbi:ABC transporter ATP-binding protein [Georgenia ruanii]|uniref:ATP-binding cassette domain-containing protein n=1 Tax=Georgenia ruanii TaxID=348442 RepID=A0A7J9USP6_9MICO|nr:ABC transporter ATP-binding protein [Georgenia ruanii]MPV87636.1 ATP-binding cassette domain-containing protein [Georgenia ruanii]
MMKVSGLDAFYGSSHVLFDVSLEIGDGESVALLGRNGAGKSTTLKSIMGLVGSTSGTVEWRGSGIRGLRPSVIARRGVAYVPEDRRIFPDLTVEQNLRMGRSANPKGALAVEEVLEMLPLLAPLVDRPGGVLSGGEQQALAIGRALIGRPALVLLDEPSEGLAPLIVESLGQVINDLRTQQGISMLLCEQNRDFALALTDRAYVLDGGRIVYSGTTAEIRAQSGDIDRLLGV